MKTNKSIKVFLSLLCLHINANAEIQFLTLDNGAKFAAVLPCSGEKKTVNSAAGITNALQCRVDNGSSVCTYVIAEQPLDVQSFNKSGFSFIAEVHRQYASMMDKNYKNVFTKLTDVGGLGKVYFYELVRSQDGLQVNVKGAWLVANNKMLRGAINCAPSGTSFMKNENEIFLNSFALYK